MVNGNFIGIYENAFPDELCDRIIAKHNELEHSVSASPCRGENVHGGVGNRKDVSFYFERDAVNIASEVNVALDECLRQYIDSYPSIGMMRFYSNVVKVQRTPPKGGFHQWHCEKGSYESVARVLVWMVYLNDLPEGEGTTEFIEQGAILQPKKGTVVLFPSAWTHTHRGNPVYSDDKYIATGWYYLSHD